MMPRERLMQNAIHEACQVLVELKMSHDPRFHLRGIRVRTNPSAGAVDYCPIYPWDIKELCLACGAAAGIAAESLLGRSPLLATGDQTPLDGLFPD